QIEAALAKYKGLRRYYRATSMTDKATAA
ncbi:MAG: hypothetical protein ACI9C4_003294, partial [Paraglaciecola sp.]